MKVKANLFRCTRFNYTRMLEASPYKEELLSSHFPKLRSVGECLSAFSFKILHLPVAHRTNDASNFEVAVQKMLESARAGGLFPNSCPWQSSCLK